MKLEQETNAEMMLELFRKEREKRLRTYCPNCNEPREFEFAGFERTSNQFLDGLRKIATY